jgi:nucleoside phosphorylase
MGGWVVDESGGVVILAPMNLEYKAVRAQLREPRQVWHPAGTAFEVGRVPGVPWQVALVVTGEGTADTAALAERAAAWFRPRALFVVGVAGGLKDDIALGDVVVATWVYGYHGGKDEAEGFQARPRAWRSAHQLEQVARMVDIKGTWKESLAEPARPSVHFKPIAAGDVVLNSRDTPLALQLRRHYNDASAIEMESAGAASAAHLNASLPVLTIRGISDKADGAKRLSDAAGLQPVAASHAAAFTMAILRELADATAAPEGAAAAQDVPAAAQDSPAHPAPDTADPGLAWRPLSGTLPMLWLPQFGSSLVAASAILELSLVPAQPSVLLEARRLAALTDELKALGRAVNMFGPAPNLSSHGDPAAVISADGTGLAVTRSGQRSAWKPLPKDTLGAVLDPADTAGHLAALLSVLLRIEVPSPAEAGLAVGVTPSIPVSEGRVSDLPRKAARLRTSMSPVRVLAADVLPFACITARPGDVAEELCARLFLAFRAQTA